MLQSLDILVLLSNKDNYLRFFKYVKKHTVSDNTYVILTDMKEWFEFSDVVEWEKFAEWFKFSKHPSIDPIKIKIFDDIFERANSWKVDEELQDKLVKTLIDLDYATRISDTALAITDHSPKHDMSHIRDMVYQYENEAGLAAEIENFVTDDIDDLLSKTKPGSGLKWRLADLNVGLGELHKGNFMAIIARPGTGKSTFLTSEATYMASQMKGDECVLWVNNEDMGERMKQRIIWSALGISEEDYFSDPTHWAREWKEHPAFGRIKLMDGFFSTTDVEARLRRLNVRLVVIDQIHKVHLASSSKSFYTNDTSYLTAQFNWCREIAKKYAPVVGTHQADSSAEGEKWIEMHQVNGSKVGIQGELDALLTIGRSRDIGEEEYRFFYTPKNKLTGKEHWKTIVRILPEIGRYAATTKELEI